MRKLLVSGMLSILLLAGSFSKASEGEVQALPLVTSQASTHSGNFQRVDWERVVGQYVFGDGFETNCSLRILRDGRFLFQLDGCLGTYERVEGRARLQRGRLHLTNPSGSPVAKLQGLYRELVVIPWGGRIYLVPSHNMLGFCNAVNRGSEPVTHGSRGSFYLREGDWDINVAGTPALPGDWQQFLLKKAIDAKVLGRDSDGSWKLDVGRHAGVYPKLELFATAPDGESFATLQVISVKGNLCHAVQIDGSQSADLTSWIVSSRADHSGTADSNQHHENSPYDGMLSF